VKSGWSAARFSATAVEIGSTVDEPETLMEPETAAGAALEGPVLAVLAAGWLAAVVGADVALPPLHAPMANAAATASAPTRLVLIITRWVLLGLDGIDATAFSDPVSVLTRRPSGGAINGAFSTR
jgi:hypothetical protein